MTSYYIIMPLILLYYYAAYIVRRSPDAADHQSGKPANVPIRLRRRYQ